MSRAAKAGLAAAALAALPTPPAVAQSQPNLLGELIKALVKPATKAAGAPAAATAPSEDRDVREAGGYMAPPELLALSGKQDFGRLATTELAGVRLGMRPAEALAALEKAGYEVTGREPAVSFADFAGYHSRVANRQNGPTLGMNGTLLIRAKRPTQTVAVRFVAWPDGSRVDAVEVEAPQERIRPEDFAASAVAKFGVPDRTAGTERYWCADPKVDCGARGGPRMALSTSSFGGSLTLSGGARSASGDTLSKLQKQEIDRLTNRVKAVEF